MSVAFDWGTFVERARQRRRAAPVLGVGRLPMHPLANDLVGHLHQVGSEHGIELPEFRPQGAIDEARRGLDHQRLLLLPDVAKGQQTISAAQRAEQTPRPGVGQTEFQLGIRLAATGIRELLTDPIGRRPSGRLLAHYRCAREQGFDLVQLVAQHCISGHRTAASAPC